MLKKSFKKNQDIKKILLLDNHGIGDVIVSIPLLKAIRDSFPDARISILLRSKLEHELIEPMNLCDDFFYFQRIKKSFIKRKSSSYDILSLLWVLRKKRFDLVINTQGINTLMAGVLSRFVGAKFRLSESKGWKRFLFNIEVLPRTVHRVERNNSLGKAIGLISFPEHPYLLIDLKARNKIEKFINEQSLLNKKLIGIHPGTKRSQFERIWPIHKYAELINMVHKTFTNTVILTFGSEDECQEIETLNSFVPNKFINTAGFFGIKETIALIERCNIFISHDGGLMYVAASLKIPTITLFGPTNSEVITPYWNNGMVIKNVNMLCSPCYDNEDYRKKCTNPICMSTIGAKEVFSAVKNYLKTLSPK